MGDKAILVDTTKCMACRGCQVACKQWNNLPAAPTKKEQQYNPGGTPKFLWVKQNEFITGPGYQNSARLDFINFSLVRFLDNGTTGDDVDGDKNWNFLKFQCLHCLAPLCTTACKYSAYIIDSDGFLRINEKRCKNNIRRRKCTKKFTVPAPCATACPWGVPQVGKKKKKGTWQKFARKCNACYKRRFPDNPENYPATAAGNPNTDPIAGDSLIGSSLMPACVTSCPDRALQYGGRTAIIAEANAIAGDAAVVATYPEVNVYGAGAFGFHSRVIMVLTRDPSAAAGNFYGFPTAFI
jgi:formate dehydrogenase iron-sulfur subunit